MQVNIADLNAHEVAAVNWTLVRVVVLVLHVRQEVADGVRQPGLSLPRAVRTVENAAMKTEIKSMSRL